MEEDNKLITKNIMKHSLKHPTDENGHVQEHRNITGLLAHSIDMKNRTGELKKRIQITADKRQTEEGVKCRKIPHE
jgi:hypothetical protein